LTSKRRTLGPYGLPKFGTAFIVHHFAKGERNPGKKQRKPKELERKELRKTAIYVDKKEA
jgi:hypothetical protein